MNSIDFNSPDPQPEKLSDFFSKIKIEEKPMTFEKLMEKSDILAAMPFVKIIDEAYNTRQSL